MKAKKILLILIPVAVIIFLWPTGLFGLLSEGIGLRSEGIANIANNTKDFTDTKGHIIHGEYSISIDLSDLKSNIGKELYNDDAHKVYVSWIDSTGSINSGGYRIGFRSVGQYSSSDASLISGAHHATVDGNSFTTTMSAKMTAQYNGKQYTSSVFATSGLNYKDGDEFAFYIFPNESYENQEISLKETGVVQLTVTDLYKNIWIKK